MAQRDIDYIAKDFDSIVDALITYATVNFGPNTAANRQWTNFNIDDFSRTWLELVAYVGDQIFFYLDVQATQSNLQTATIRSAVLNIAKQFGYAVPTASSASGLARFTLNTPGTIPVGFKLSAENGSIFFTSSSSPAPGSTSLEVFIPVIQGTQRSENFTARGVQNEEITLGFSPLVSDIINPITSLRSPTVTVNGNDFTLVNSFIRSLPTDKHYIATITSEGQSVLRFGDGIFGKHLAPNDAIVVKYRTGGGSIGNIPSSTLNTLIDTLSIITSVTNTDPFSGGSEESSVDRLRELIPDSLKTLERAVTVDDFGDILLANFSSVSKALAEQNINDPGIDVNVYVVPAGNTISKISTNLSLFNSISAFLDKRKTVTTVFKILDAFGMDIDIKIRAFLAAGASRSLVESNITAALQTFFSLDDGDVTGTGTKFGQKILLNDIYSVLDTLEGIERFEIIKLTYEPRAINTVAVGTNYLISPIQIYTNTEQAEWLIGPNEYLGLDFPNDVAFTVFKKLDGKVSNLGQDSLTDETINLSVIESKTTGVNTNGTDNVVLDSSRTFIVDEFVGGEFLFVDANENIWSITDNDAHSIVLSAFAINNTIVSDVAGGDYKIVRSLIGKNILFHGLVFAGIDYNTHNTVFRLNSSFNLVGTIGDKFQISIPQANIGDFGRPITLDNFTSNTPTPGTGRVHCAGNPDLSGITVGVNSNYVLIDSNLNVFEVVAVSILAKTIDILHDASSTPAPAFGVPANPSSNGKPASIVKRYYSDNNDISFVIGLANRATGLGFQAQGSIVLGSTLTGAGIADGKQFSLTDEARTIAVGGAVRLTNVVTITTETAHTFSIGQTVQISGVSDATFNGNFVIVATPLPNTFTYAQVLGNASSGAGSVKHIVTFEFNKTGGVSGSNIAINYVNGDNAAALKTIIITAINGASSLAITASDGLGIDAPNEVVLLQNDSIGIQGNNNISDPAVVGITVNGMAGGIGSGHSIPTPVVPGTGESVNDFGISTDGTTVDHFEFRTSGFVDDVVNLRNSEIPQINVNDIELDFRGGVT